MSKKNCYDTIVIGAGPAGMTAAIYAAADGARVLVLDRLDKVGKKLLVTGNGRCNLTNLDQKPEYYRSDAPDKAWSIFSASDESTTLQLMERLGVMTRSREGYIYPYNEQAATVREALEVYLNSIKTIHVMTEMTVTDLEPAGKGIGISEEDYRNTEGLKDIPEDYQNTEGLKERPEEEHQHMGFMVHTRSPEGRKSFSGRTVIIATGGLAGTGLGCEGDGYRFARKLGHRIISPEPALTALCSGAPFLKKLNGVRSRSAVTLYINGRERARERGELQWTDYGISGVAVFCLSRFAIRALKKGDQVSVSVDFVPDMEEEALIRQLIRMKTDCGYKDGITFLHGWAAAKLAPVLLKEARIRPDGSVSDWDKDDIRRLAGVLKGFELRIRGYKSYEKAQVTMGGIPLDELSSHLESRICPGLFFAGEVVDVDGTCGGYNLQWAFSSGKTAGEAARFKLRNHFSSQTRVSQSPI
ncbi:MAG: aminoacetone oxidase family FAD-binding enzyme [Eubacterium sp.]|nr:aminoacetone oxidase family FAD-binding enzyme [Eubacterium sp.]